MVESFFLKAGERPSYVLDRALIAAADGITATTYSFGYTGFYLYATRFVLSSFTVFAIGFVKLC